jgi:uncharacterized protein
MKKPGTPFPTSGYYGPEYFCDRQEETKTLLRNIKGGQSTVLTSVRRIGKTGLIKHVLEQLPSGTHGIYIDILATENLKDFLNAMATAIVNSFPDKPGIGSKMWTVIKTLRPVLSYDPLNGTPQVSFDLKPKESETHISSLFSIIESHKSRFVIAIDEFQQILQYPEKNTESYLRTIIQQLSNIVFIFSGSHQHLMDKIFSVPSSPFYRSTSFLHLDKIERESYSTFIREKFLESNRKISKEEIDKMLEWTNGHTFYVQMLCNRLFLTGYKNITAENWHDEASRLLKEQEPVFFNYRELLTRQQWHLLKAIALEGEVYSPTSNEFTNKYNLGNPSSVLRSLNALKSKELLSTVQDTEGKSYFSVYDMFFRRWVERV